jgi:hypothetical protein
MDFKTISPATIIYNSDLRKEFVKVYNQSGLGYLDDCKNCNGKFHNAILKYQNKHNMSTKKYLLKANKVLPFENSHYVNANLTDEIAERAVKAGWGHLFAKIPVVSEEVAFEDLPQEPIKRGRKRKV